MKRRKLTRRERWVIFERSDGECAICGINLEFDEPWHADHIIAFIKTGRTIPSEMQATCPPCNLRKGIQDGISIQNIFPCYRT